MDKEFILNEIRRTAKENNGKPLGKLALYNASGIKESDWAGKYWVRWNDALAEAGFQANTYNTAYDKNFLYEKYAALIQEIGHIPVANELRLKARIDKSFPAAMTFSRLGTKLDILNSILQYCNDRNELADVADICEAAIKRIKPTTKNESLSEDAKDGYVYLIKSGSHYKIGYTNDIHRRGKEIAIELPERATTIHVITTDDPPGIEAYWHNRFKARRGNGEWFSLTPSDIKAFRRRKFM